MYYYRIRGNYQNYLLRGGPSQVKSHELDLHPFAGQAHEGVETMAGHLVFIYDFGGPENPLLTGDAGVLSVAHWKVN